ncbi:MAG TPA: hypothetical protein VNS61_10035 [Caldimonas sp.]|nr:hypothetical protein [Caldimonas sp.]
MEPFTHDEEAQLFEKLDRLSLPELQSYIGSAKTSLSNKSLDTTWRPRIEIALQRAETNQVREEAAAVLAAAAATAPPAATKAKKAA